MKNINLENKKITPGFQIPNGYFEDFEHRILQKATSNQNTKTGNIWKNKRVWMTSIAAVFLVSIALPVYFSMQTTTHSVDAEVLETHISMHPVSSNYEMTNLLTDDDLADLENDLFLNNEDVESYLQQNYQNFDLYINQ